MEKEIEMELMIRVKRLEKSLRVAIAALALALAALAGIVWQTRITDASMLRVRGVTVVDQRGTDRVWIGAPVPDPIVQGEQRPRSGPISGVILLDANGNERAG